MCVLSFFAGPLVRTLSFFSAVGAGEPGDPGAGVVDRKEPVVGEPDAGEPEDGNPGWESFDFWCLRREDPTEGERGDDEANDGEPVDGAPRDGEPGAPLYRSCLTDLWAAAMGGFAEGGFTGDVVAGPDGFAVAGIDGRALAGLGGIVIFPLSGAPVDCPAAGFVEPGEGSRAGESSRPAEGPRAGAAAPGTSRKLPVSFFEIPANHRLPGQLHTPINSNSSRINRSQRLLSLLPPVGILRSSRTSIAFQDSPPSGIVTWDSLSAHGLLC